LSDDLVAEPHPDPAAGGLSKWWWRLEAGHCSPDQRHQRSATLWSAGVDLVLGLLLLAVGALVATGRRQLMAYTALILGAYLAVTGVVRLS
jgi:hypothetical protein